MSMGTTGPMSLARTAANRIDEVFFSVRIAVDHPAT